MNKFRLIKMGASIGVLLLGALWASAAFSYPYWTDGAGGYCAKCHGGAFKGMDHYTSKVDREDWGYNLMFGHARGMGVPCTACHTTPGDNPPLNRSSGLSGAGCMGCHGRAEDQIGDGTGFGNCTTMVGLGIFLNKEGEEGVMLNCGQGLGLRAHHMAKIPRKANCYSCHSKDYLRPPVGEGVKPANFAAMGWLPCSDAQYGPTGLDNDGDDLYDMNDPDCDPTADTDGDGVLDLDDNCPTTPNPNQANADGDNFGDACEPDVDGDGVLDDDDNCVFDPNTNQLDQDSDFVGDVCDNCDFIPNPGQEDSNNDGVGDHCYPGVNGEVCTDGVDNDLDGDIDCADRNCRRDAACDGGGAGATEKQCKNGADDDGDGQVDCADPDCTGSRWCN